MQLLHLPDTREPAVVAEEMIKVIKALPDELRRVPISASTYYEWITKTPTRRELRDAELIEIITAQREDKKTGKFVQTLGSRKMWIRLRGQGLRWPLHGRADHG